MKALWTVISDPGKHVKDVLGQEAADIPTGKIEQGQWFLCTLPLDDIQIDQSMIKRHDGNHLYIKKRDDFVSSIKAGRRINPLIVIGENLFLVDGYARYRALKKLGITEAQVFRQQIINVRNE